MPRDRRKSDGRTWGESIVVEMALVARGDQVGLLNPILPRAPLDIARGMLRLAQGRGGGSVAFGVGLRWCESVETAKWPRGRIVAVGGIDC